MRKIRSYGISAVALLMNVVALLLWFVLWKFGDTPAYYEYVFVVYLALFPLALAKKEDIEKKDKWRTMIYAVTSNIFCVIPYAVEARKIPQYKITVPAISIGVFVLLITAFEVTGIFANDWIIKLLIIGFFVSMVTAFLANKYCITFQEQQVIWQEMKNRNKNNRDEEEERENERRPSPREGL